MPIVRFDTFSFDITAQELKKEDRLIDLRPKPARLLAVFLASGGAVLSKQDLIEQVWDERANEQVLFQTISELRKALDDSSRNPRYIANVKKRGYRWIGQVEQHADPTSKRPLLWAAMILLFLGLAATYWFTREEPEPPRVVRLALIHEGDEDTPAKGLLNIVATTLNSQGTIEVMPNAEVVPFAEEFRLVEPDQDKVAELLLKLLGLDYVVFCSLEKQDKAYVLAHTMYSLQGRVKEGNIKQPTPAQVATPMAEQVLHFFRVLDDYQDLSGPFSKNSEVTAAYATAEQAMEMANFSLARTYYERCLGMDPNFQWARVRLARCLEELNELERSAALNREVIAHLGTKMDPELHRLCLRNMASLAMRRGDFEEAHRFRQTILEKLDRKQHPVRYARARLDLGVTLLEMGKEQAARTHYLAALEMFRDEGYHLGLAHAYNNLGVFYHKQERHEEAGEYLQYALEIYQRMGSNWYASTALANLGNLSYRLGDVAQQRIYDEQAIQLARKSGNIRSLARTFNSYGLAEERQGRRKQAIGYLKSGHELFDSDARVEEHVVLTFNLARLHLESEVIGSAGSYIEQFGKLTQFEDEGYYKLKVYYGIATETCDEAQKAMNWLREKHADNWTESLQDLAVRLKEACG